MAGIIAKSIPVPFELEVKLHDDSVRLGRVGHCKYHK